MVMVIVTAAEANPTSSTCTLYDVLREVFFCWIGMDYEAEYV